MKRNLLLMVVIGAVVVGTAWADGVRVRATVPFDFYVGNDILPAGEYLFEMKSLSRGSASASNVIVSTADGKVLALRMSLPGSANPEGDRLHFLRYGSTHFLASIEGMGFQANLTKSSIERKLIAEGLPAEGVTLVAAK